MLNFKPLSQTEINSIKSILNPQIRLTKVLRRQCEDINDIFVRLNEEQFRLLESFENCKKLTVTGRAGTGKTLLAIEKCRREASKGKKVLFLCFNSSLADNIRESIGDIFSIHTVHSYALQYLRSHHPARIIGFEDHENFDYMMQEFVEVSEYVKEQWDCIIIDEGQDFKPEWVTFINNLLEDSGVFYIFYDPLQEMYSPLIETDHAYLELEVGAPFKLKRNMRNTDEISKGTLNAINAEFDESYFNGIKGRDIEVVALEDKADVAKTFDDVVNRLVNINYVNPESITALTLETISSSLIKNSNMLNNIFFTSARKFKGLENDVVVIVDCNLSFISDPVRQRLLYVAMSRARVHLVLIIYIDSQYKSYFLDQWKCKDEKELIDKIKIKIIGGGE